MNVKNTITVVSWELLLLCHVNDSWTNFHTVWQNLVASKDAMKLGAQIIFVQLFTGCTAEKTGLILLFLKLNMQLIY